MTSLLTSQILKEHLRNIECWLPGHRCAFSHLWPLRLSLLGIFLLLGTRCFPTPRTPPHPQQPCSGLAGGGRCPSFLALATADQRHLSSQLHRESRGGSAPPSRARSWTCWRRSSPRLATLTSSCARRWRSRSTCPSPESRCAQQRASPRRGSGKGGRCGGGPTNLG